MILLNIFEKKEELSTLRIDCTLKSVALILFMFLVTTSHYTSIISEIYSQGNIQVGDVTKRGFYWEKC